MIIEYKNKDVYIKNVDFSLSKTFDCGQTFRFCPDAEDNKKWTGVAFDRVIRLEQLDEDMVVIRDTSRQEFEKIWRNYFDLDTDYSELINKYCGDYHLSAACEYSKGLRLLNQQPFETLISFIISQNNNIPRIKGIIERLCSQFGRKIEEGYYSFPTPEILANLSEEELAGIRSGFRARYIIDAAKKVHSNQVELSGLPFMGIEQARKKLMEIKGVGTKVADCVLLFSLGYYSAFPRDVWINRALAALYPQGFPDDIAVKPGIAQQYLFNYVRNNPDILTESLITK